jgi:hypothetical protein
VRWRYDHRDHTSGFDEDLIAGLPSPEWETTSSRYPEEPDGLLALDPQLVCYSWMTGIAEVAQVVFVRKRLFEVQYLRTTITDEQRAEFGQLVEEHDP